MSGIIKAGQRQSGPDACQSVAFNLEDISSRANHYLDAVRRQAARILSDAKQQAKQLEDRARAEGCQAAQRDATQQMQAQLDQRLQTALPALEQAVAELRQSQQAWLKHWERQTVRLACAIAARIVRRELARSPDITLHLVREALELATGGSRVRLHLNPQDHQTVSEQLPALVSRLHELAPAEVIADPEISPGGCRVATEFGWIDQQIEAQLARIEEELT